MHQEGETTLTPQRVAGKPATVAGTARFIARCLLIASCEPRYAALVPPKNRDLHRRLLVAAGDAAFVRATESQLFRNVFQTMTGFLLPGITLHYLARKRCLEDWLRRAIAPGDQGDGHCQQIVVLGAGLDTLTWRLHREQPSICFVELDRPVTLQIKESAMTAEGSKASNLTLLAADLSHETLAQILGLNPTFNPALRTLFLAEGLLMYLPPERVQSLLREIAALQTSSGPTLVAFTFMEARADGSIRFRRSNPLVKWWLRRQGEPFRWSIGPEQLKDFLMQAGWSVCELVSGDHLQCRYLMSAKLREAPLAKGEWLALAQTSAKS